MNLSELREIAKIFEDNKVHMLEDGSSLTVVLSKDLLKMISFIEKVMNRARRNLYRNDCGICISQQKEFNEWLIEFEKEFEE